MALMRNEIDRVNTVLAKSGQGGYRPQMWAGWVRPHILGRVGKATYVGRVGTGHIFWAGWVHATYVGRVGTGHICAHMHVHT